ncbi:MAG: AtpZ/AtpI family protein [Saprospiraceae bacterium]
MEQEGNKPKKSNQDKKKPLKKELASYNRYSEYLGIVFQALFIIVGGVLLGQFLDGRLIPSSETPWFTLVLSLVGLVFAMYIMIKKLERE